MTPLIRLKYQRIAWAGLAHVICAAAVILFLNDLTHVLLEDEVEEIIGHRDEVLWMIAAGLPADPWAIETAFAETRIEIESGPSSSAAEFIQTYQDHVRQGLQGEERYLHRLTLSARLHALGHGAWPQGLRLPEGLLAEVLREEAPGAWGGELMRLAAERLEELEADEALNDGVHTQAVQDFLRRTGDWEEDHHCHALEFEDGQKNIANYSLEDDADFLWINDELALVSAGAGDGESSRTCLIIPTELIDGRWLTGTPSPVSVDALRRLIQAEIPVIAVALISMLLTGALIWRGTGRHQQELIQAAQAMTRGELAYRIDSPSRLGAQRETAEALNASLAALETRLNDARHVSDRIAHDLRTPLTRLRGQIDLLKHMDAATPDVLDAIENSADQLLSTFSTLLRITQIESGGSQGRFERFSLQPVLIDALEAYEPLFGEKNLRVVSQLSGEGAVIHGQPDLWMQAFSNLFDNAYKFSPKGGQLRLRLTLDPSPAAALMTLEDQGPGIAEIERKRVFQRFYRGKQTAGTKGNGLGLSFVSAVCAAHQATIKMERSVTLGGLLVSLRIPLATGS